eukprot:TRINITY_DN513_c0_g1_i1.p1 TRINITY_DN513_c0_g1~~TRINITY_DN513_c0_g1_i1.p1  ORF type:complete len:390 (+),score=169.27 TRINITY_DN513_c0_g1_i1:79-1248(+)
MDINSILNGNFDIKEKETQIYQLGQKLATERRTNELQELLRSIRPFFATIPKARTAKIIRTLIDIIAKLPDTLQLQVELCKESISWAKEEKRNFLRQRIEARLAALYFQTKEYATAISLISQLSREMKRLDDKNLLVEIHLTESKVQHALRNIPKAKAALTSARTAANAIYCPPALQGEIDMQAGTLHAEEHDYKTSFSYFFESLESYASLDDPNASLALKYMLLCKIMLNTPQDVDALINSKIKYAGPSIESMRAIANAAKNRSLKQFEDALKTYKQDLTDDPLIHSHLSDLNDNLLEQNLSRIIEPFSCVEISRVAQLIGLNVDTVEKKLSMMILDKKLNGVLDQGTGSLIIFEEQETSKTYVATLDTIQYMSKVVDTLFEKSRFLS